MLRSFFPRSGSGIVPTLSSVSRPLSQHRSTDASTHPPARARLLAACVRRQRPAARLDSGQGGRHRRAAGRLAPRAAAHVPFRAGSRRARPAAQRLPARGHPLARVRAGRGVPRHHRRRLRHRLVEADHRHRRRLDGHAAARRGSTSRSMGAAASATRSTPSATSRAAPSRTRRRAFFASARASGSPAASRWSSRIATSSPTRSGLRSTRT